MKIMYNIGRILVLFFFVIGVLMLIVTVHELKHYYDIKNVEDIELGGICAINIPVGSSNDDFVWGYIKYTFPVGSSNDDFVWGYIKYTSPVDNLKDIHTSEFTAWFLGILAYTIVLFIGFNFIFLSKHMKRTNGITT